MNKPDSVLLSLFMSSNYKWARPWENVSYAICEQQRRRSACASAQSDQHLCCSLPRQNDNSSLYIRNFKIVAGPCSWAGQFVSCLVGNSPRHILSCRGLNATLLTPPPPPPAVLSAVLYIRDNHEWAHWTKRTRKYKLHYDEVQGEFSGPSHIT